MVTIISFKYLTYFTLDFKLKIKAYIYMLIYKKVTKKVIPVLVQEWPLQKWWALCCMQPLPESLVGLEFHMVPSELNEPHTSFLSKLEEISQNTLCTKQHQY